MTDVFISYSRKNAVFARLLMDKLILAGKDAWVDWEGIPLTSPNWWAEIKAGIEGADNFVFILSPASMASVVCNMELDYALELNKRIVPVVYQDVSTREAFASIADFTPDEAMEERLQGKDALIIARDNWQRISHINWVFFRETDDFDTGFDTLVKTVETDLDYVKAHTRYLTRAREWEREKHRPDLLLFGGEIDRAESWLTQAEGYAASAEADKKAGIVNPLPKDLHKTYIHASRQADKRRRRQVLTAQLSIVGLIAVLIIVGAISSNIITQTQQNIALAETQVGEANIALTAVAQEIDEGEARIESLRLSDESRRILSDDGNIETALLLAIRAEKISETEQATAALNNALSRYTSSVIMQDIPMGFSNIAISPDRQQLAFVPESSDEEIVIWNIAASKEDKRFSFDFGSTFSVQSAGFVDDSIFYIMTLEGLVITYNLDSQERLLTLYDEQPNLPFPSFLVSNVAFSPTGERVIICGSHTTVYDNNGQQFNPERIKVFDLSQMRNRMQARATDYMSVATESDFVTAPSANLCTFSRDGDYIYAIIDGDLTVFDAQTKQPIHLYEGYYLYTLSADNTLLIGVSNNQITLWNPETHAALGSVSLNPSITIDHIAVSENNQLFATSSGSQALLWDIKSLKVVKSLSGHTHTISDLVFIEDDRLLTTALSGEVRLWQTENNSFAPVSFMFPDSYRRFESGVSGRDVVIINTRRDVQVWDAITGSLTHNLIMKDQRRPNEENQLSHGAYLSVLNPDETVIYASGFLGLAAWDITSGETLFRVQLEEHTRWSNFFFLSNGDIGAITDKGELEIRGASDGRLIFSTSLPDRSRRVIAHSDSHVLLTDNGEIFHLLSLEDGVWETKNHLTDFPTDLIPEFLPTFASEVNIDNQKATIRNWRWDVDSGVTITQNNDIAKIAISNHGRLVATISNVRDRAIYLWNMPNVERYQTIILEGDDEFPREIMFTSDNSRIVVLTTRDRFQILPVIDTLTPCQRLPRDFTAEERQQFGITDNEPTCPQFAIAD